MTANMDYAGIVGAPPLPELVLGAGAAGVVDALPLPELARMEFSIAVQLSAQPAVLGCQRLAEALRVGLQRLGCRTPHG